MLRNVVTETVTELFFSEEYFEHAQNAAALIVTDLVKDFVDFCCFFHCNFNWVGAGERIKAKGFYGFHFNELTPELPFRIESVGCFKAHPGCEALVQPERVPPFHGHQIAEPLVGDFMRDDFGDALLDGCGGCVLVKEDGNFPEGDGAPIFHCLGGEVRDCNEVQLRQGVGAFEVFVVICEQFFCQVEGELALLLFARGGDDAN